MPQNPVNRKASRHTDKRKAFHRATGGRQDVSHNSTCLCDAVCTNAVCTRPQYITQAGAVMNNKYHYSLVNVGKNLLLLGHDIPH